MRTLLVLSVLVGLLVGAEPRVTRAAEAAPRDSGTVQPVQAASATCHASGWAALSLPGARGSIAMDLTAVDGRVMWVVGMHAGRGVPRRPWAVRRTDDGWRSVTMPRVGTDAGLVAVDATSTGNAWSVGFRAVGEALRPVALRWSGGRWRDISPAWRSGGSAALTGVSIGRHAWAVGYRTSPHGPRPYALRWRSGTWRRHDPQVGRAGFGALTAAASIRGSGTWAAGWVSDGRSIRARLWRWQSDRWVLETLPGIPGTEAVITGLTARGRRLWAVGYRVDGPLLRAIVLVREPSGWASVPIPEVSGSILADALVVDPDDGLMIAGSARRAESDRLVHAVATMSETELSVTRRPAGIEGESHLRSAVSDRRRTMAVGWTDGRAIVLRSCGTLAVTGSVRLALNEPSNTERPAAAGRPSATIEPRLRSRSGGPSSAAAPRAVRLAHGRSSPVAVRAVRFRDVASRKGLDLVTVTYGGTSLDVDGDGWDDLLISRHQQRARLLLGHGGRFAPAPADPLPGRDRHGCASADVDADGRDEAYCAIGAARGVKFKSNELFMDLAGRRASDRSGPAGVGEHLGRGRSAAFVRVDGDDLPDLLVTSDPVRVDGLPSLDRLYRSVDGASLRSSPELGLDLPAGGSCAFSAQLDGGGRHEIAICTTEPWRGGRGLHLFRYDGERYVDATRALGLEPRGAIDAVAADFDGDGAMDIAQLSVTQLSVSLQRAGGFRRVVVKDIGSGRALAAGDVNADGRADLYVVRGGSGNAPDRLLINRRQGRAFRAATIPQARYGGADDVITVDHDHNGLADFVVLNGFGRAGPIQLIAAYRR